MADPILHIKDSYYFEVPKLLYPYEYGSARQFPPVWISLDPEFQEWEFERLYQKLTVKGAGLPPKDQALHDWHQWVHADHANFAKPFKVFLEEKYQGHYAKFKDWRSALIAEAQKKNDGSIDAVRRLRFGDYRDHLKTTGTPDAAYLEFLAWRETHESAFVQAKDQAGGQQAIREWKEAIDKREIADWSSAKIKVYNQQLSGKILIPQPFAKLRNLYEKESGFAISKYMLIELFVGLVLLVVFYQFGQRIAHGRPAKGKLWNLIEVFLVFVRDQIARQILGSHDHGHAEQHAAAEVHGHHAPSVSDTSHAHAHRASAPAGKHHAHRTDPATKFLPLLWTIFFFILGCNLMGMVPWAGAPTAALAVTFALALVTFATVWVFGILEFGFVGFFLNQIPSIALGRPKNPLLLAVVVVFETLLKVMILAIELLGLGIKHAVLSVRLLANMVAGHLVILAVMGLAFGAEAALYFSNPATPGWQWWLTATIAVLGSAAFSCLELFVAFLQAYVFTFLSALFINFAIHKH